MDEHLVITEPDRFYGDAVYFLLVDWPPDLLSKALETVTGSPEKLVIYVHPPEDSNFKWLLDTAYQSQFILVNCGHSGQSDIVKGQLLTKPNTYYFGRPDLEKLFLNSTNDPIGTMLTLLSTKLPKEKQ